LKINKLLAGTLALVLIAGLGTPAFADPQITQSDSPPLTPSEISNIQTSQNIVFDNGGAPDANAGFTLINTQTMAEDFIIDTNTLVTDFHFVSIGDPTNLEHTIFADAGGFPGAVLASGIPQNLVTSQIGATILFEVGFDLEDPFLAEAGVQYWFGLHSPNTLPNVDGAWVFSNSGGFGSNTAIIVPPGTWVIDSVHSWFQLSGNQVTVGGEIIPIETTSLILAGAQSFSWMIPVILSVLGIGLFVVSRKSGNS